MCVGGGGLYSEGRSLSPGIQSDPLLISWELLPPPPPPPDCWLADNGLQRSSAKLGKTTAVYYRVKKKTYIHVRVNMGMQSLGSLVSYTDSKNRWKFKFNRMGWSETHEFHSTPPTNIHWNFNTCGFLSISLAGHLSATARIANFFSFNWKIKCFFLN